MRIRVSSAEPGDRGSHVLELLDLPDLLQQMGWQLQRVASGARGTPTLTVRLREPPHVEEVLDAEVNLEVMPDSTQAQLNARVVFRGLREVLDQRFGYGRAARAGTELSLRVYLPGYDGGYLQSGDSEADEPPSDRPRERVLAGILRRRGAKKFRDALRQRYGDRCVITGCSVVDVLEAAHIRPYRNDLDNAATNGLLLRADVHTLFDLDLIGIDPGTLKVRAARNVRYEPYLGLDGRELNLEGQEIDRDALRERWVGFQARMSESED